MGPIEMKESTSVIWQVYELFGFQTCWVVERHGRKRTLSARSYRDEMVGLVSWSTRQGRLLDQHHNQQNEGRTSVTISKTRVYTKSWPTREVDEDHEEEEHDQHRERQEGEYEGDRGRSTRPTRRATGIMKRKNMTSREGGEQEDHEGDEHEKERTL